MTNCPSCSVELTLDATFCGCCGERVRTRRDTLTGSEIDARYRLDAKIAEGGFGAIYRATQLDTGAEVALKVLHAELAADPNVSARFRREGAVLSQLRDPHTVRTFDVGETSGGVLYIAMELLRGESLLDRLGRRGPLPWRLVLETMRAVCHALAEAHALGIVHRDLKPANIHLEARDFVKVLDFGIAKPIHGSTSDDGSELTRAGQAIGTLEYMAPEQMIGAACDGRSDIYALGVVAYEMLTGQRPFPDATGPASLVTALMTRSVPPPSALVGARDEAPALDRLVLGCLERDPGDRFATVGEVLAAIDAVLGPERIACDAWFDEPGDDEPTWIDAVPPARPTPPESVLPAGPHTPAAGHPAPRPAAPYHAFSMPRSDPAPRRAPVTSLFPAARLREPTPFGFDVSGSTVRPAPCAPPAAEPKRRGLGLAHLLCWAVGLLTSGAALGIVVATLAA